MTKEEKQKIRERIWKLMEEKNIARFPLPLYGRIPNFVGSEEAAERIRELEEWEKAKVIKINPDSPQRRIRELVLKENKTLIMATPRLKEGFLILKNLQKIAHEASSIKGAFKHGKKIGINELPKVDLIVTGSVAVTEDGARVGKSSGYGDLEYAISKELRIVDENTPRVTNVHEIQIVSYIPMEKHDVPVDYIITPKRIIRTNTKYHKPRGIYWEMITEEMLNEIPILKELKPK
ncbi:MAG: 5-formyltetrahydrofolate cyclo-ligase [Candidatus Aenigmarchaeota archaeon]|nr:5-formyltetrahydrofolate cyclo-ligase [Candidatus Aenigmarchaeota archaeon]